MTDVTRIWAVVLRSARKCTRCMRLQRLHSSAVERPGVHLACQQTNCQDSTADGNYNRTKNISMPCMNYKCSLQLEPQDHAERRKGNPS